ncbi:MAG: hypothetical protein H6622_12685 [Halobacteriovoraceae bacterium]|nr:hypothetical protein [Halobacteriovoraceae bacterium]
MSIRKLNLIFSVIIVLSIIVFIYVFARNIFTKEFKELDKIEMRNTIKSVEKTIFSKVDSYKRILDGESQWDELHSQANYLDQPFFKNVYTHQNLKEYQMDGLIGLNKNGKTFGIQLNFEEFKSDQEKKIIELIENEKLIQVFQLKNGEKLEKFSTFIEIGGNPYLVVGRGIDKTKPNFNYNGLIICIRNLKKLLNEEISAQMGLDISALGLNDKEVDNLGASHVITNSSTSSLSEGIEFISNDRIAGYFLVTDHNLKTISILKISKLRVFNLKGQEIFDKIVYGVLFIFLFFTTIRLYFLDTMVISRISKLAKNVIRIGEDDESLNYRLSCHKNDEIGKLCLKINQMLDLIQERHNSLKIVLNNIGQGLLSFDRKGNIKDHYSEAVRMMFQTEVTHTSLAKILGEKKEYVDKFVSGLFNGPLTFEEMRELCPKEKEINGKILGFEYKKIVNKYNEFVEVLMLISDITSKKELEKFEEEVKQNTDSLVASLSSIDSFLDVQDRVIRMEQNLKNVDKYKIDIHDLKSKFAFLKMYELADLCTNIEDILHRGDSYNSIEHFQLIKKKIDMFYMKNEEILGPLIKESNSVVIPNEKFLQIKQMVKKSLGQTKFEEIETYFLKENLSDHLRWLNRNVISLSSSLNKKVNPITWQGNVYIDPSNYESIFLKLGHIINNMLDHGIESPEERKIANKNEFGTVKISIKENDDFILLELSDDGRGIDKEKLTEIANSREYKYNSDLELYNIIFDEGISTNSQENSISGAGLGLYDLKTEILKKGGQISVESETGLGTKFTIQIPKKLKQVA